MLIDIHLGHNAEYTLSYQLFDNSVAEYVWNCYKQNNYKFISRTQFYNFGETPTDVQAKLTESIDNIKRLRPNIVPDNTDLNRLHESFPDNVHEAEGELRHWLSMFNYHLHHLEDIQRQANTRFVVCIAEGEPQPRPLTDTEYQYFTPVRLQNHLYANYPHVGKHILELVSDNDIDVPAEHIVPTSIAKADLLGWLAPDQLLGQEAEVNTAVENFCKLIEHKLPCAMGDPRLSIGWIELGKLISEPDLHQIGQNKYLHSIESR